MKKNWLQILSLALNVTLLITLLVTRAELVNTRTILKSNLDGIAWRLFDMDDQMCIRDRSEAGWKVGD